MPDLTWTSEADWQNAQESEDVKVDSGSFGLAPAIPSSALTEDMVAWYRFENGDGGDFASSNRYPGETWGDGAEYDGTVNSASHLSGGGVEDWENGANSGAFRFNGSTDYIGLPDVSDSADFTVCAWVKPDAPSQSVKPQEQMIVAMGDDASGKDRWMLICRDGDGDGTFRFSFFYDMRDVGGAESPCDSPETFSGDQYHFVVGTFGSQGSKIYVNGSQEASNSSSDSVNSFRDSLAIGRADDDTSYIDADVDDVRLYNKALTASEINDIYAQTQP